MNKKIRTIFKPMAVCGALLFVSACAGRPEIAQMRCEYAVSPIAIDTPQPRFTWVYDDADDFVQAGYRLAVATSAEALASEEAQGDVWNSGDVTVAEPFAKMPAAGLLKSGTPYFWRVVARDAAGGTIVSPVAVFETAVLDPAEWRAEWITDSKDKDQAAAPMLRRAFAVKEGLASARLYVSAAAYARTQINGQDVSENRLDPGYTHYDKRNLYAVHDVTKLLTVGENAISAVLGNGFYNEIAPVAVWNFHNARWRNRARLFCELHLRYADGTQEVICSDGSWTAAKEGPYVINNIYSGDTYDARKEYPGWNRPDFDDSGWEAATVVEAPSPVLKAQVCPAVQAVEENAPVAVRSFGDTVYVFDFGRNMTGFCRLKVQGEAGTTVALEHGELLKDDGRIEMRNINPYFHPMPGYAFQTDVYILRGGEPEVWSPDFTYHGFRYVELKADRPIKLDEESLTALFLHTAVPSVGKFECSNETFNKVWAATRQSYLSNLTSIPTDCPQREKNGWTADAALSMDLALLNYDGMSFYEKWLDDIVDNQTPEGRISGIIPTAGWGYDDWIGPVWDASMFIIPRTLYYYYGDVAPLEKMWPVWEKYLAFLATREEPDGGVTYGIGDWLSYKTGTPTDYTSTCYYYLDNVIMAEAAGLLGHDGSAYAAKAGVLRDLINTKYYNPETGLYANGSQAAQGVALYLGIATDTQAQRVADNLAAMVIANDCFLDFGTIGSKTVLRMLTKYGHADTAFRMASKEEIPSWGGWIKQGYTTLGETWPLSPEWRDASVNHVFMGDIAAWFVNDLAGINYDPAKPGFRHIVIAPHFVEGLDQAEAEYDSVVGRIRSAWKRDGERVKLEIKVPANTTATVRVDGKEVAKVGAGEHSYTF